MSQAGAISSSGGSGTNTIYNVSVFEPNNVLQLYDDFIPSGSNDDDGGQLGWRSYGSGVNTITTLSANHPGIMEISSITFGGGFTSAGFGLYDKLDHNGIIVGGGTLSVSWIVDLITLSNGTNRYITNLGLSDAPADPFLNGIYFSYSDNINGGNWSANCQSGGVTTSVNTGVAATTGFNTFTIVVNSTGTSVNYLINNVSVATVATNIPTVALSFFVNNVPVIGSTPLTQVDLFYFVNDLSTPRPGPTFSTGGGGSGNLVLIESQTAAASATIDFTTNLTGYDQYKLVFYNVITSGATSMFLQYSTDGGATYVSTNYYNSGACSDNAGNFFGNNVTNGSAFKFVNTLATLPADFGLIGDYTFNTFQSSSICKSISGFLYDGANQWATFGYCASLTTAVNAIQINLDAGTITSGTFKLYGVQN